jgi:phospholipid/cholesterol/gamma-HCH transport system substrate-binding protein
MAASSRIAIGIFVIGGILLFAIGLFWIGDRRQFFSDNMELFTEFKNVSGLARGAKVRVAGLDAGEVLEIIVPPQPDARFRIHFRVVTRFQPILRADSKASIQNDGLVGNKFLQVDAGTSATAAVAPGSTIMSREPIEISDLLAQASDTVKSANQAVEDIRGGITQTVAAVLDLNKQTSEVISDVGAQVDKFASTGNRITDDVSSIVTSVKQGQGTIGKIITDDRLYNQLRDLASEGQMTMTNFKGASEDMKTISEDLKARGIGDKVEQVADNIQTLAQEALATIRSFQSPDGASGGLMADVRQTLSNANEAMSDLAEDMEALKRSFFFRGFFNNRGYFDLDTVTVGDYREGRFLPDRQKVSEWLEGSTIFGNSAAGREQLTPQGREKLDFAMASFLRYSKNEPFVIESWAGPGTEPSSVLRARERGIMVSDYLIKKFDLKPNYVGVMPMNAVPAAGQARDGIGLVLFPPKPPRK